MLKQYSDTHAEITCLAVHPRYRLLLLFLYLLLSSFYFLFIFVIRREGRGETLLAYLERRGYI